MTPFVAGMLARLTMTTNARLAAVNAKTRFRREIHWLADRTSSTVFIITLFQHLSLEEL
jgi:hypothetical protein